MMIGTRSMQWSARRRLYFRDCPPDPQPHKLTITVASVEHWAGQPASFEVLLIPVITKREINRRAGAGARSVGAAVVTIALLAVIVVGMVLS